MSKELSTTRFQTLRSPIILTDLAIDQLNQQLGQHGWLFGEAVIDRKDGRSLCELTIERLLTLDETWWMDCETLKLRFRKQVGDGSASISFNVPPQMMLSPEIKTYVSTSDYGSSLAVEEEFRRFSLANAATYGVLARASFWWSLWWFLQATDMLARVLRHSHGGLSLSSKIILGILEYSTIAMIFAGRKLFFPMIQIRLGAANNRANKNDNRRKLIGRVFWEVVKLGSAAAFGAWVQVILTKK